MAANAADAHPYAVFGARYRIVFPIFDGSGALVSGAAGLDSERSLDQGAFADCTNEASEIGSSGMYSLDLTSAETQATAVAVIVKTTTPGAKTTPRVIPVKRLPVLRSGTAQAGAAGSITLDSGASSKDGAYVGCAVRCINNTPSNVQGQLRWITAYSGSTKVATVNANWGTNPSSATTFEILVPETANVAALLNADPGFVVDNLNATVSSRATQASVDTVAGYVDTEVASILSDTGALTSRLTAARAGYLDNLNVGGLVASSAEVTGIQNNTRTVITVPEVIELPESGTQTREIHLFLYDEAGNMEAPDAAPTVALTNQAGTNLSARLDSTTMASVETGHFKTVYTASAGDAVEQLIWIFAVVENGVTRKYGRQSQILQGSAAGGAVLQDSSVNYGVIAKAIRAFDSSGISQDAGSVEKRLQDAPAEALTAYDAPNRTDLASAKNEIVTNVLINRTRIDGVKAQTDLLDFAGGKVKATLGGETVDANVIEIEGDPEIDGLSIKDMLRNFIAALQGNVERDVNTYRFKDQNGVVVFSYTVSSTGRVEA